MFSSCINCQKNSSTISLASWSSLDVVDGGMNGSSEFTVSYPSFCFLFSHLAISLSMYAQSHISSIVLMVKHYLFIWTFLVLLMNYINGVLTMTRDTSNLFIFLVSTSSFINLLKNFFLYACTRTPYIRHQIYLFAPISRFSQALTILNCLLKN